MSRARPWASWVGAGSLGMAALAVLALGATLFVALRALHAAESTVVRGESDALLAALSQDFFAEDMALPPSQEFLQRELSAHAEQGLRYLGVVERDGSTVLVEAGEAALRTARVRPGELIIEGRRVRVAHMFIPPRRHGPLFGRGNGPTWLMVELEPPIIQQLQGDLTRISVVAAGAGVVLLGFALALSRNARRIEAFERKAAREQRLVSLGSMASVMAHELRNPLASLKGHAQLLAEELENDEPKRLQRAERVVSEAERLERLTSSLLDFVRDGPLERETLTPAALIERALHDLDATRVRTELDAAPATLDVDAARMARALHNLIENALQADEHGTVRVRVRDAGELVVEVRDHGPGIDKDAKLFEPFSTTRVRGTGLGLSVVRRIAEQHGGSVTGITHPEGGALFTLRVPQPKASA